MKDQINEKIFDDFPECESDRLIYREFNKNDACDLLLIRSDAQVMEFMDSPEYENIQDAEKAIIENQNLFKERQGINWAIIEKSTDELIGYFGFWRLVKRHCRAEIGFALKPQFWGKGIMKETMNRLINFGFSELNLHSIEANVNPENEKSERLLVKFGFKKEAYFRENFFYNGIFKDSIIYSILETDLNCNE